MNRPNTYYPGRSAAERRAESVGTQTKGMFTWMLSIVATLVVGFCVVVSMWRAAAADAVSPFGARSEVFPSKFDVPANIGDFILGASWTDLAKNISMIILVIFFLHLLRPVLPFGRKR